MADMRSSGKNGQEQEGQLQAQTANIQVLHLYLQASSHASFSAFGPVIILVQNSHVLVHVLVRTTAMYWCIYWCAQQP